MEKNVVEVLIISVILMMVIVLCIAKDFDQETSLLCCFCRCAKWIRRVRKKKKMRVLKQGIQSNKVKNLTHMSQPTYSKRIYPPRDAGGRSRTKVVLQQKVKILNFLKGKHRRSLSADCVIYIV